jgi:hypothetical protein
MRMHTMRTHIPLHAHAHTPHHTTKNLKPERDAVDMMARASAEWERAFSQCDRRPNRSQPPSAAVSDAQARLRAWIKVCWVGVLRV